MKRRIRNITILFLLFLPGICTVDAMNINPADSTTKQGFKTPVHSVYFTGGYGNNLVLGSSISKPLSFYYGSLCYGFKNELFLSASSFYLPVFEKVPAYNVLTVNYNHAFNSWFDLSLGANWFGPQNELSDTLFTGFLYGEVILGFDWKIAYTRVSASRVFSGPGVNFAQVRNSRYFQTPEFFSGKMYVSFDPYINLLLGSLTRITTSEGTSIGVSSPVWTGSGSGNGSGSGSGSGGGSGSSGSTPVSSTSVFFGIMEIDVGLPVALNTGRFTIEAEPGYILPMFTDPSIPNPKGFSIMLSFITRIL